MADDILDAAQKAINDASKTGATAPAPVEPPAVPPPIPPVPPPPMPAQTPTVPTEPLDTEKQQMINELLKDKAAMPSPIVPPAATQPTPSGGTPPTNKPKKKNIALVMVGLFLFLGTLAAGAYFVAKPDSLADIRNEAAAPKNPDKVNLSGAQLEKYNTCREDSGRAKCAAKYGAKPLEVDVPDSWDPNNQCPGGSYPCGNGTKSFCSTDSQKTCIQQMQEKGWTTNIGNVRCVQIKNEATGLLEWSADPAAGYTKEVYLQVNKQCFDNQGSFTALGTEKYICKEGVMGGEIVYTGGECTARNGKKFTGNLNCICGTVQVDTSKGHESYSGTCGCDKEPNTVVEIPTPTPTGIAPICLNIKVYKGGVQVSPATLLPGDAVVFAVKGNLTPTKARFRINGGAFTETTTKNASDEFTLNFTVPDGVPSFVIEAEVFTNGAFH